MTKLDDLREFIRSKNKKEEPQYKKSTEKEEKQEYSLEVGGATDNPLASFGDDDTDKDLIDQLYSSPRGRVLRGDGAVWDQD
jgi:hypothetical protein